MTRCPRAFAALLALGLAAALPLPVAQAATAAPPSAPARPDAARQLDAAAEAWYRGYYGLFPVAATENVGDPAFEGAFEVDIAPAHRARQRALYEGTLRALQRIDARALDDEQRLTLQLLRYEASQRLALLAHPSHLLPVTHMDPMPLKLAQWAAGTAAQPLATVAQHEHFLQRLRGLPAWIDQAIDNMDDGIARGIVQPRPIIERLLPQLDALLPADPAQSPFLAGTRSFPADMPAAEQARLRSAYGELVQRQMAPAVAKLRDYLKDRYLPHCRDTAGIGALPGGAAWYRALVKDSTTTTMTPAQIHALGLKEVARIRGEMEQVKARFGFSGTLNEFFASLDRRPELTPFREEQQILDAFAGLNRKIMAQLPRLFERAPKAALEIRAVEPVRRDTASDYYLPPAVDGTRPGLFYTNVPDPAKYRNTGMTSLFLHEGQPGHHYQMALQQELHVPRFRQVLWYDAYGEGWALYAEGLGRDIGLYDDPNAYLGRLFMELHRALRLVVDTGLHAQGWSREKTIAYLREMEGSTEASARRATERYMAWPGQALAYKVGELKIIALREQARAALGERFDIRRFHGEVLGEGTMPLAMLETRVKAWIAAEKRAQEGKA